VLFVEFLQEGLPFLLPHLTKRVLQLMALLACSNTSAVC
jgi:hypothetical protein